MFWISAVVLASGCKFPEAPEWHIDLIVPLPADSVSVDEVLPAAVGTRVADGEPVFVIEPMGGEAVLRIGDLCGESCQALEGLELPVPGFVGIDTLQLLLEPTISRAELRAARLRLRFENGLGFDPLRPHPDLRAAGRITLVTRSLVTGALVDSTVISGASVRLAPGSEFLVEKRLTAVVITEGTRTVATIQSPADGQRMVFDLDQRFTIHVTLDQIELESLDAVVVADTVGTAYRIDRGGEIRQEILGSLDNRVTNVERGTIDVRVSHEMDVDGTLEMSIAASTRELFAGGPGEIRLHEIDFSRAPHGRTSKHTLAPEQIARLVELEELHLGYRGVLSASRAGPDGRPTLRIAPNQGATIQLTVGVRLRVGL